MKQEFKGTKGEWEVSKISGVIMGVGIDLGDGYSRDIFHFTDLESETNQADVNLIVTAPEMLEALQKIVYGIETGLGNRHQLRVAKNAINKALGL